MTRKQYKQFRRLQRDARTRLCYYYIREMEREITPKGDPGFPLTEYPKGKKYKKHNGHSTWRGYFFCKNCPDTSKS